MTKMTKKEMFAQVIAIVEASENENAVALIEALNHEVELLEKRKSSSTKSKHKEENNVLMDLIAECLGRLDKAVTITELQKECEEMAEYSNQKISALLKKLCEEGTVKKVVDKKKSYFSLV